MLRALFDERRRAEIRDALKSNKPIEFRSRLPKDDAPPVASYDQDGPSRYKEMPRALSQGAMDNIIRTNRILARMAKAVAKAEGNQKPKEDEPEESGKNQ
ncbi:hypothetical protein L0Y65_03720 [Candidatus Micrarchaeota archaeon]|nr:hypothetical protein [Candidatus Micrarchaeota archaeon]